MKKKKDLGLKITATVALVWSVSFLLYVAYDNLSHLAQPDTVLAGTTESEKFNIEYLTDYGAMGTYLLTDEDANEQYIIVKFGESVAITPRYYNSSLSGFNLYEE